MADKYYKQIWRNNGKVFGYPSCCIEDFCQTHPHDRTENQKKVGEMRTGFIPCPTHADQVVSGEVELGDLISNRNPEIPQFPHDNG